MRNTRNLALVDTGPQLKQHEGAWVCSYETELPITMEQAQQQLPPLVQVLQNQIDSAGGIVGHIKIHISEQGKALVLSATGGEVNQIDCSDIRLAVDFTAIAILQDGELFRDSVESLFIALDV